MLGKSTSPSSLCEPSVVNVCVCVVSPRKPAQPLQGSSTIVTSAAARINISRMAMGTSLLCDTLSLHPSGTRAWLLHLGPHCWNIAIEPTSTWQNKSAYIQWCLLRQVDHLALEGTPQRTVHVQEPMPAALYQGKGATTGQDSTGAVDTSAYGMLLPRAGTLPLHRKSFCLKTMAYLWRTRLKCQRGASRRQCPPVLSVERTVGHQEQLFFSFI